MNCPTCDGPVTIHKKASYDYTECGLDNVQLVGVEVRHCDKCGDAAVLPDLPGLHRVIARAVACSPVPLIDKQIAFLAKYVAYSDHPASKVGASIQNKLSLGVHLNDELRLIIAPAIRVATLAIVGGPQAAMSKFMEQFMKATGTSGALSRPVTVRRSMRGTGEKWKAEQVATP